MNIKKAKQILRENGYRLTIGKKLSEAFSTLKNNGFYLNEAKADFYDYEEDEDPSEDDYADDEEGDSDEDSTNNAKGASKSNAETKNLVKKLKHAKSYDQFVNVLKGMNEEQSKLLRSLVGDGEFAKPVHAKKGSLSVKLLHPTQQEIDVNNSLLFPLKKNPSGIPEILEGDSPITINKSPIVVYKHEGTYYIIDGHHRWSQVYLLNPNAKMTCILYTAPEGESESPVDMLRDFQLVIKAQTGEVKVAEADSKWNIYKLNSNAVKKYVLENISDKAVEQWQTVQEEADKESIADYIARNGSKLSENNAPADGAPRRNIMPQTDPHTLAVAAKGMTDV